jgi:hypothetical protein
MTIPEYITALERRCQDLERWIDNPFFRPISVEEYRSELRDKTNLLTAIRALEDIQNGASILSHSTANAALTAITQTQP